MQGKLEKDCRVIELKSCHFCRSYHGRWDVGLKINSNILRHFNLLFEYLQ